MQEAMLFLVVASRPAGMRGIQETEIESQRCSTHSFAQHACAPARMSQDTFSHMNKISRLKIFDSRVIQDSVPKSHFYISYMRKGNQAAKEL
jgi:hypothetical protein